MQLLHHALRFTFWASVTARRLNFSRISSRLSHSRRTMWKQSMTMVALGKLCLAMLNMESLKSMVISVTFARSASGKCVTPAEPRPRPCGGPLIGTFATPFKIRCRYDVGETLSRHRRKKGTGCKSRTDPAAVTTTTLPLVGRYAFRSLSLSTVRPMRMGRIPGGGSKSEDLPAPLCQIRHRSLRCPRGQVFPDGQAGQWRASGAAETSLHSIMHMRPGRLIRLIMLFALLLVGCISQRTTNPTTLYYLPS